jgi:hypothetical protein
MRPSSLFHGSQVKISGFLEPRKALDNSNPDNCLMAVYATDDLFIAKSMSLPRVCPSFSDYGGEDKKRVYMHKGPRDEELCFVYEVSSETFSRTNGAHQWISSVRVPIIKTYIFKASYLFNCWRLATEEEFNQKWKKFGYPSPYKEFFENRKNPDAPGRI